MQENINKARIRGSELMLSKQVNNWNFTSNITLLDPKDLSTGDVLLKRAKQEMNIIFDRFYGRFSVGGEFRAKSKTIDYGNAKIPGYGVLDLRTSMQIMPTLKAEARLVNTFDKEYQTSFGYNSEPRGVFAQVTWSPDV